MIVARASAIDVGHGPMTAKGGIVSARVEGFVFSAKCSSSRSEVVAGRIWPASRDEHVMSTVSCTRLFQYLVQWSSLARAPKS